MALLPSDPKEQKKVVVGLLPLLLLGAYWYFYHGSRQEEITALETRLEQLETLNAAARARAQAGGPDLEKKLALYEQHITRLEELVPKSEEVPELLHDMTLRAQESGVELAKLKPDEEQPGEFYTLKTFQIAIYGGYHDVGRFLAAIGSLPRIVAPIEVTVRSRNEVDRSGVSRLQADFRIKTYTLPRPAEVEAKTDAST